MIIIRNNETFKAFLSCKRENDNLQRQPLQIKIPAQMALQAGLNRLIETSEKQMIESVYAIQHQ